MGIRRFSSGTRWADLATAARISRLAFCVASSLSSITHETCSRMLQCSNRNWFRPARATARRNVISWRLGEQAATITRFRPCSRTFCSITPWPGSEQKNMCFVAQTTPGSRAASCTTRSTSTTSEMFPPHWQTNTPIRGALLPPLFPAPSEVASRLMTFTPERSSNYMTTTDTYAQTLTFRKNQLTAEIDLPGCGGRDRDRTSHSDLSPWTALSHGLTTLHSHFRSTASSGCQRQRSAGSSGNPATL